MEADFIELITGNEQDSKKLSNEYLEKLMMEEDLNTASANGELFLFTDNMYKSKNPGGF